MNTFLRLSLFTLVCLGLALMLGGNVAAQEPANIRFVAETEQEVVIKPIEVGDTIPLTITLRRGDRPVGNTPVTFMPVVPGSATVNPSSGRTDASGAVTTEVTFHQEGPVDIRVVAPALESVYTHTFRVGVGAATRVVATPVTSNGQAIGDLAVGDSFTYKIEVKNVQDLAAWQMDVAFDPNVLRVRAITAGDFLDSDDGLVPSFRAGSDNGHGKIVGTSQVRIGRLNAEGDLLLTDIVKSRLEGVSGSGELLSIQFEVLEFAETTIGLHNVQLSESKRHDSTPWFNHSHVPSRISHYVVTNPVVVTHQFPKQDVDRNGLVDVRDLVIVASSLGKVGKVNINPRADLNDDGIVTILDLVLVTQHATWGKNVTPAKVRNANDQIGGAPLIARTGQPAARLSQTIQGWIARAQVEDDGSAIFGRGIANLKALLASRIPSETKLLLNYPNPFNPETWIPYQLAESADVTVTIHSVNGRLIRTLAFGHQAAGVYQRKNEAAYWDGRNEFGEQVASGLYFYTLTAGNFSATAKMLVRK